MVVSFNINVFFRQGRVVCNFPYTLIEVSNLSPIVEERRKEHNQINNNKFWKLILVQIRIIFVGTLYYEGIH